MPPYALPLKSAASYVHIGRKRLVRYAREGKVVGWQDKDNRNAWMFKRESLEQFIDRQGYNDAAKLARRLMGQLT